LPALHRAQHRVRIGHLHADHPHLGPHRLDVGRHTGDQPTAANGHEDRIQRALVLAQDLHRHRALAGDHIGIVEGVHEGQALRLLDLQRVLVGIAVAVAVQQHFATQCSHRIDLELGRRDRHHDHGAAVQALGRQRHALGMVAGTSADNPTLQRVGRQPHHLVVGPAQLETEHGLLVLALEQHLVGQTARQAARRFQRGFARHVINTGGEDALEVIGCDALRTRTCGARGGGVSGTGTACGHGLGGADEGGG
jgi:hypothetical protein